MKKKLKLAITVVIMVVLGYLIYDNAGDIYNKGLYLYSKFISSGIKQTLIDSDYKKQVNYDYVQIDKDTVINSKDDIKNAVYTFLDGGWDQYLVKCSPDYEECTSDVKSINNDATFMTKLTGFVHPYNQVIKTQFTISVTGVIRIKRVQESYTDEQIKLVNKRIDQIYNEYYDESKNVRENIEIFHDYIVNNTKYDEEGSFADSNNAYGVLYNGYGICSGYTDTMSLFLEKLHVKNYRISNDKHTWNLVFVDGVWQHLDTTWDDPKTNDNRDTLRHDYFLISTEALFNNDDGTHVFDTTFFKEAE